ncbi:MAG TPA: Spy/CpxP family protein refolding chaperone [Gammaproteobacteria bacterium]|nr:Spy/CpxP family protein refolding chaperone [Gammaproteobacteria bacterium]
MKRIRLLSLLALSGLVLGFGSVHAADHDDCGPPSGMMHMGVPGPGMHMKWMTDELGLTDEQKSKLEAWHKERKERKDGHRDATRKMHKEMRELMNADTVDEAAIRAKVREFTDAHADMAVEHAYFMQYFRSILTPEQLEKFKAMQAEQHDEFMGKGFFHRRAH